MHPSGIASVPASGGHPGRQRQTESVSRSAQPQRRVYTDDSWIEISSRPSTSSLSSAGGNENTQVVTTGLEVRRRSNRRAHSLRLTDFPGATRRPGPSSAAGSSQDEYEESESESDRVLNSSTEDMTQLMGGDADDDDNSTALAGQVPEPSVFTPQPNAFSHPPSSREASAESAPQSYFPPVASDRTTETDRIRRPLAPRTFNSLPRSFPDNRRAFSRQSSHQDHDAALRASLTTLLSCAAAVRHTPKSRDTRHQQTRPQPSNRVEPATMRLVPESELLGESSSSKSPSPPCSASKRSSPERPVANVVKRKIRERETSKDRGSKKARNVVANTKSAVDYPASADMIMPSSLMAWMISAGIVLVFSAVSFSAGYAWGKEVGRFEGEMGLGVSTGNATQCGQEALRTGVSLRRLKWSTAVSSARA